VSLRAVLLGALASLAGAPATAGAATVTWATYVEPPGTEPEESCSRYAACPPPTLTITDSGAETNDVSIEAGTSTS
jgi:hypothetical protein